MKNNIAGFAFGDTETTGISFLNTDIIEISFLLGHVGSNIDDDCESINIKVNLPNHYVWDKGAEEVHGISEEIAKTHGVSQIEAIKTINTAMQTVYGDKCKDVRIVGANAYFDYVQLQNMYERNGAGKVPFSYRMIDVNQLGLVLGCGESLSEISEFLKLDVDESKKHGAEYDTYLHRTVFYKLLTLAEEKGISFI